MLIGIMFMNLKIVQIFIKRNKNWKLSLSGKVISRKYVFKDFKEALTFIQIAGGEAERVNHHPEIMLKKYRFITIRLTTHRCDGLSALDLQLARRLEKIYRSLI